MAAVSRAGRIIGVLMIAQMVASWIVNFVLEAPLFGTPGFLVSAAPHARQIGLAAILGLVTEGMWLGIAITAFPTVCQRARRMAIWLVALAAAILAIAVVENAGVMSMVSLSEAYANASAAERGQLQTVRIVVASARNWAHFLARMIDGSAAFVFFAVLYRGALIPRALAGLGLIASMLMVTAVGMPFFGRDVMFQLLAPMGVTQLVVALWLIARGFRVQVGDCEAAAEQPLARGGRRDEQDAPRR